MFFVADTSRPSSVVSEIAAGTATELCGIAEVREDGASHDP